MGCLQLRAHTPKDSAVTTLRPTFGDEGRSRDRPRTGRSGSRWALSEHVDHLCHNRVETRPPPRLCPSRPHLIPASCLTRFLPSTALMSQQPRVVYLEDLEKPAAAIKENVAVTADETDDETTVVQTETRAAAIADPKSASRKTQTGATKRQRSLLDMMPSAPSSSPTSRSTTTKIAKTDLPTLNSIPLSMSDFQNSLSDEAKRLLTLECESMGKSWLVLSVTLLVIGG